MIMIAAAAVIMPALLILAAMIPKDAIKENSLKSAEYLYEQELFDCAVGEIEGSRIDRYADSILLNIAYHFDPSYPVKSVILSAYYFTPDHEENENYLMGVRDDRGITRQYFRYWHGSLVYVRPLLTLLPVKGIYILNACVLAVLLAACIYVFIKNGEPVPAVAMLISLILTRSWYVPLSLEYTWTFMLMFTGSLIVFFIFKKGYGYGVFFAISGMVTAFVDFLTTETLTLLVPLLLILWLDRRHLAGSEDKLWRLPVRSTLAWGIGYAGMWSSKWIITSIVMHENAFSYVSENVEERIGGDLGIGTWEYITGAISRNIGCLFPFGYGAAGGFAFIALIIFAAYRGYVYRTRPINRNYIITLAVLGLVPYLRFLILHNHAYLHCFFTYRAQMATIMAVVMIISHMTEKTD